MAETTSHFIFMAAYLKCLEMITVMLLRFYIFICSRGLRDQFNIQVFMLGCGRFFFGLVARHYLNLAGFIV
jgi:hypothetical protein